MSQSGKQVVSTSLAPLAIGPYSQAIRIGTLVACSGQIPIDPVTKELVHGDVTAQTRQVLINLRNVLASAGCSLSNVIKTTVFLTDLSQFSAMNAVYSEFFADSPPARSTIQVSALPKNALVEIEALAVAPE